MPKSFVIIPTYNELENIRQIIDAVLTLQEEFHVLIVDDGSPDGTADIVKVYLTNTLIDYLLKSEKASKA